MTKTSEERKKDNEWPGRYEIYSFSNTSLSVISFKPDQDMRARTLVYWNGVSSIYSQLVTSLRATRTQSRIRLFFDVIAKGMRSQVFPFVALYFRRILIHYPFNFTLLSLPLFSAKYKLYISRL